LNERITPYPLRLEPDLRAWLEQQSVLNKRSLNQEISFILDQAKQAAGDQKPTPEQPQE
jgi:hypothetical protein